jgi:hypothetical protein
MKSALNNKYMSELEIGKTFSREAPFPGIFSNNNIQHLNLSIMVQKTLSLISFLSRIGLFIFSLFLISNIFWAQNPKNSVPPYNKQSPCKPIPNKAPAKMFEFLMCTDGVIPTVRMKAEIKLAFGTSLLLKSDISKYCLTGLIV